MKRWETDTMIDLVQTVVKEQNLANVKVVSSMFGGDHDTNVIRITGKGFDSLYLCGFDSENSLGDDRDDAIVEMLEFTDGQDSRGGLNSDNTDTGILYGALSARLRQRGWIVVPTMDAYF